MWFTEDAWSPIICCLVLSGVCFIVYVQTQRAKFLYPIAILLLAAVTIFFAEKALVTDREQVEQRLQELITTFVEESKTTNAGSNLETYRCFEYFAENNTTDRARVAAALRLVVVQDDVRVPSIETRMEEGADQATVEFRANGTVSLTTAGGRHFASRWRLTWTKQSGEWKVTDTKMLNVTNGSEMPIPRVD